LNAFRRLGFYCGSVVERKTKRSSENIRPDEQPQGIIDKNPADLFRFADISDGLAVDATQ
jgi:hypothetical protein